MRSIDVNKLTEKQKAYAACRKIEQQFGDLSLQKAMFGIVRLAIVDYAEYLKKKKKMEEKMAKHKDDNAKQRIALWHASSRSAVNYLFERPDIYHAEMCGVDSNWIRRVIKESGLSEG